MLHKFCEEQDEEYREEWNYEEDGAEVNDEDEQNPIFFPETLIRLTHFYC